MRRGNFILLHHNSTKVEVWVNHLHINEIGTGNNGGTFIALSYHDEESFFLVKEDADEIFALIAS